MRVTTTEKHTLRYHVFVKRQITQTKLEPSAECNLEISRQHLLNTNVFVLNTKVFVYVQHDKNTNIMYKH